MPEVYVQRTAQFQQSLQLGQATPADTNAASIYSSADGVHTEITSIVVCNTGAAAVTYRIFHDEDGTTYDDTTALYYDVSLNNGASIVLEPGIFMTNPSGNLAVRTSVANDLTFTVYGKEIQVRAR